MKRRPRGSGAIEITRDGQYRARFSFDAGVREDIDGSPFASYEDAEAALDGILAQLRESGAARGGTRLRHVVARMFEQRAAAGYASTGGDESRWRTYFAKHSLAERPVRDITQGEVLDAILGFRRKKDGTSLALSTRKNILNIIRAALYVAKADGHVETNVLVDAAFPDPKGKGKKQRRKRRAITWEQFEMLWKSSRSAPELAVAIWAGCRQGELRALHWSDVHNVEGSKCTCEEHRGDPHLVIRYGRPPVYGTDCSPKSGETRVVSLFGLGLEALRTMPRANPAKNPNGIVFVSRLNGYRAKGRLVGRLAWAEWRNGAGVLPRWQDLRHTCGTWLVRGELRMGIDAAWPLEAVKEHLGHAELRTTEIYADQREGSQAKAMAARARGDLPALSPQERGQVWSHLRGLNSRPTVYERQRIDSYHAQLRRLAGLTRGYEEAVAAGDPLCHARGLDLAEAVRDFAEAELAGVVVRVSA